MGKSNKVSAIPQQGANSQPIAKVTATAFHSGPLPAPALLQGYENIKAGFAERIVQMAEGESSHRHKLEEKALTADIHASDREFTERRVGQILAFLIVIIMASMGLYLALNGKEIAGSVFGGPAIVAIVGAFLYRKKENHTP